MRYDRVAVPPGEVPKTAQPVFQHIVDTYASETNKTASVWRAFADEDLIWRPHPRSTVVEDIFKHQLLSERRFFGEFLGRAEPPANEILPDRRTVEAYTQRVVELAAARLSWLAATTEAQWLAEANFFGERRQHIWIFWRRVLHTAHHRTQLTVYLRLLNKTVPSTYGPTADVTWSGADPTTSADAAERG